MPIFHKLVWFFTGLRLQYKYEKTGLIIGCLKRYDWIPSAGGFTEDNTNIEQKQIKAAVHNEMFYYKSITIKPVTKHTFSPLHNTASQGKDINTNLQSKKSYQSNF